MKKRFHLLALLTAVAFPLLASAHGPTRQEIKVTTTINAPAAKVWAMVKDFGGIGKWLPPVKKVTMLDKKTRQLNIGKVNGPTVTEELKKLDDKKMSMKYRMVKMGIIKTDKFDDRQAPYHVLPVNNYSSKISVKPTADGKGSVVTWKGYFYREWVFNPPWPKGQGDDDAKNAITSLYKEGLANLKKVLEK